jgi:hypothetical protein
MAYEPGGMAEKLGNRYEGKWVSKQLLALINEEIKSVTVELVGTREQGVDLLVIRKDNISQFQQCKARFGSKESFSVSDIDSYGILNNMKDHFNCDPKNEFAIVSAISSRTFADICESARNSNDNPSDFYKYQIYEIGKLRRDVFDDYCKYLKLNPGDKHDLILAIDYLKHTYIVHYPEDQNTWSDLLYKANILLTGDPETAITILRNYVENNDKYHKAIYSDEIRKHLAEKHHVYPRKLEHDTRIAPAIERLKVQFRESIKPSLISDTLIPRKETLQVIESIEADRDAILHGSAGNGKSGVLYELSKYLDQKNIPYLPIRLDRNIPDKNAEQFGKDIGLQTSPVHSLIGMAAGRKCILLLDQLDAIRWTNAHSSSAIEICKELVRQIQSLNREGTKIVVIFTCRSYDLENDPEIKNLFKDPNNQNFNKILVQELSDTQLKEVIGKDFNILTKSQKLILACPMNLSIWMKLKEDETLSDFSSATELMRQFWENRYKVIKKEANISSGQINEVLEPLLDYMENQGEISAPISILNGRPDVRDDLISCGILQIDSNKIMFCHQHYLDYKISERILQKIYSGKGTIFAWLGPKENQSLFRREQLRQVLATLSEEDQSSFLTNAKELLESSNIRFHLKHLILELFGQLNTISSEIGIYCLSLLNSNFWNQHILGTVLYNHSSWVLYLLNQGIVANWLLSEEDKKVNQALWLLRSVSEYMPDEVTKILLPFLDKGGNWPKQILNTICWNEVDDSEQMFELRLNLTRLGYIKDYIDWDSLCTSKPLNTIRLVEAILSTWKINEKEKEKSKKIRMEKWYDKDLNALNGAVKRYPIQTWDRLINHIQRLTSIDDNNDSCIEKWKEDYQEEKETDIARGVVKLVILAGQALAAEQPDKLLKRTAILENSTSPIIQEIIMSTYTHLPRYHADIGIKWLIEDTDRFRLGSGYIESEYMPAVNLITNLSPYCSEELFQILEDKIIHYHAPNERENAKYYLENWQNRQLDYYWGETQYFLLPALYSKRIKPETVALIHVLERKFACYPKENFLRRGSSFGGWVGSKLDQNLRKISDKAWISIVTSKKVTAYGKDNWAHVNGGFLETSIDQFARSLEKIAKDYPERFGQLALNFPYDVHHNYISSILDALGKNEPDPKLSEDQRNAWQPASIETIEAVLEKFKSGDDRSTAISFCRLISERADENWSNKTIARLIYYAKNHPDLENGKLNVYCDKSSDGANVNILFQNTINCVRGKAAIAIGQLLWKDKNRLELLRDAIESLVRDPHPVVRMASIEAIMPVLNIDRNLAILWFCLACKEDARVAAYPRAYYFFNSLPNYLDQLGPIIREMIASSFDDVAEEGAKEVTARWIFSDLFEEEFKKCSKGTIPQRKGVVRILSYLIHNKKYSNYCQELLRHFFNDPEKEVRDQIHGIFRKGNLLNNIRYGSFLKEFIRSQAFADDPHQFIQDLKELSGSLIPFAEAIFTVCEEFSTNLKEKTRDNSSIYPYLNSKTSTILLSLYEQAHGEKNKEVSSRCLDIWDLLFENRVGSVRELTKAIEK